ncbi:MAG: hypothetical protein R3D53_08880 [Paracoccaceae bacterium]
MSVLLRNNRGDLIPLSAFASIGTGFSLPAITRQDRVHSVAVEADLAGCGADLARVIARVEPRWPQLPAGPLNWEGLAADYLDASGGVATLFAMALAIVFRRALGAV